MVYLHAHRSLHKHQHKHARFLISIEINQCHSHNKQCRFVRKRARTQQLSIILSKYPPLIRKLTRARALHRTFSLPVRGPRLEPLSGWNNIDSNRLLCWTLCELFTHKYWQNIRRAYARTINTHTFRWCWLDLGTKIAIPESRLCVWMCGFSVSAYVHHFNGPLHLMFACDYDNFKCKAHEPKKNMAIARGATH